MYQLKNETDFPDITSFFFDQYWMKVGWFSNSRNVGRRFSTIYEILFTDL
jgi:hypothetical protein